VRCRISVDKRLPLGRRHDIKCIELAGGEARRMILWSGAVTTMGVGVFVSKSYKKGKGGAGREPLPSLSLALYRRSSMKLSSKEDEWRVSDWSYTRSLLFHQ
jgi:hypothetical protein